MTHTPKLVLNAVETLWTTFLVERDNVLESRMVGLFLKRSSLTLRLVGVKEVNNGRSLLWCPMNPFCT